MDKSMLLAGQWTRGSSMQPERLSAMQGMLIGAAAAGDRASVEAILDEGVDPNGTTTDGQTALDVAATGDIIDLLRNHGGVNGSRPPRGLIARFLHLLA